MAIRTAPAPAGLPSSPSTPSSERIRGMQDSTTRPKITGLSHLIRSAVHRCTRKPRSKLLPEESYDTGSQRSGYQSISVFSTSNINLPHFVHLNTVTLSSLKAQPSLRALSVDDIRRTSFARLGDQVYVDYMGGCIAPEQLIRWHSTFLQNEVLGNTHSISQR